MKQIDDSKTRKHNLIRFLKFCISGTTASIVEIVIFAGLASWLQVNTFLANGVAIGVSMIIGYLMNRHYTFRHRHPHPSSFILFVLLNAWDVVFSSWLIDMVAVEDPWHKVPVKILTLLICAVWNYIAYKHLIFRNHETNPAGEPAKDKSSQP